MLSREHTIGVFVFDGVQLLDVCGPIEVFSEAAKRGAPYVTTLVSPDGASVRSSAGVVLGVDVAAAHSPRLETLVVAGSDELPAGNSERRVLARSVLAMAEGVPRVASVCTGAFLLAEAGILRGRRATTHWRHAPALVHQFPSIEVESDAIFVRSGHILTSAGVTAGIDLALALVEEDCGPQLAREVARQLVVFMQRPGGQSQFSVRTSVSNVSNLLVREVLDRIVKDPAGDHGTATLAHNARVSERHLRRLFRSELGITPSQYVERIRLEQARLLLEAGSSVTAAARESGLGSDETLRRVFITAYGTTPSDYRQRFATTRRNR